MEGVVRAVTEHPFVAMAVCFAALLIAYFLFKSLIRIALIVIIITVAIGGYLYFQYPDSRPVSLKDAVEKARTGAGKAVDQGKHAYEKGRETVGKGEAVEKGKEFVDKGKAVLHKGIAKGKAVVERVKEAVGDIGQILCGNPEEGDRRKP
jgi:hypothetical protein